MNDTVIVEMWQINITHRKHYDCHFPDMHPWVSQAVNKLTSLFSNTADKDEQMHV